MEGRTELCKHKGPCFTNTLLGFVRGAVIGVTTRFLLATISLLIKRKLFQNPQKLLKIFSNGRFRYVALLSLLVGLYRGTLCLMRRLTKNDHTSSMVAGAVSSLSLFVEESSTRKTWALFTLVRGMESWIKYMVEQGRLPRIPYFIEMLYIVTVVPLHYGMMFEPDAVHKQYQKPAMKFIGAWPGERRMLDAMAQQHRLKMMKK